MSTCAALALLSAWFYLWSVHQPGGGWAVASKDAPGYYGAQAEGFRHGHLYLSIAPQPALLSLQDPFDPVANAPYRAHDLSLRDGHYYMYFGVSPVLLLFLPVSVVTGRYPTEPAAVAIFCIAAVWTGMAILLAVRRRHFPGAPAWALVLGALCLAFATPLTILAEAPQFYQVPIACAISLQALMLAAVYRALESPRPLRWLAAAGLLLGLSLGARPNYLLSAVALLVPVLVRGLGAEPARRRVAVLKSAAAAFGPPLACGVALLLYNRARFGSLAEFGMHFQLAGERFTKLKQLSPAFLPEHLALYLFGPGTWQLYFPFFAPLVGQPFGLLRYSPWMWLAGLALVGPAMAHGVSAGRYRAFALAVALTAVANLVLLGCFFGSTNRYPGDYAQAWLLLAGLGALAAAERVGHGRRWPALIASLAAAVSLAFCAAAYSSNFPGQDAFPRAARALNWPVYAWQRWNHQEFGGLRLVLRLPAAPPGVPEPLLETGRQPDQRDWLQIDYLKSREAQLGLYHTGSGLFLSRRFPVPADRELTVELEFGALIPPFNFPSFADWSRKDYDEIRRAVTVRVNGFEVMNLALEGYGSSPLDWQIGHLAWAAGGVRPRFSGKIVSVERLPLVRPAGARTRVNRPGPLELSVLFPANRTGGADPLIVTGEGDRSDILSCIYRGPHELQFSFDHWGNGGPRSAIIPYDIDVPHSVVVLTEAIAGSARGRLAVVFDGQTQLDLEQAFYPTSPGSIVLGDNPFGASGVDRAFTGRILSCRNVGMERIPPVADTGRYGAVVVKLSFPLTAAGSSEPLVVSGRPGAGDFIYVHYLDAEHVSFGFDHWSVGGKVSPPIRVDYSVPHRLEISMNSLFPPGDTASTANGVRVVLDGVVVLAANLPTYPSSPNEITIGRNQIQGSTCGAAFSGSILSVSRLPSSAIPP